MKNQGFREMVTADERYLVALERAAKDTPEWREAALSLKTWYLRNQSWTYKQRDLVKRIARVVRSNKKARESICILYAISDGAGHIKIGYTSDLKKRISNMQTGHFKTLNVAWSMDCGMKSQSQAVALERKLHRFCKESRVKGEWFNDDCLQRLEEFQPRT